MMMEMSTTGTTYLNNRRLKKKKKIEFQLLYIIAKNIEGHKIDIFISCSYLQASGLLIA